MRGNGDGAGSDVKLRKTKKRYRGEIQRQISEIIVQMKRKQGRGYWKLKTKQRMHLHKLQIESRLLCRSHDTLRYDKYHSLDNRPSSC